MNFQIYNYIMKRKFKLWYMVNNSTIINKTNNYLSFQRIVEHKRDLHVLP